MAQEGTETSREVLMRVLSDMPQHDPAYGGWWSSLEGTWLYENIIRRIGRPIAATANRQYGLDYEPTDIANTAVMVLRQEILQAGLRRSDDPWAYLAKTLLRELYRGGGSYFRSELTDQALMAFTHAGRTTVPVTLACAVDSTVELLHPLSALDREVLADAVLYFAECGHRRLSHLFTEASIDPELTGIGLCREQILAIANAVLGSRPDHATNSLIAGYLTDPEFDPHSSLPHRRALNKFHKRMLAAAPEYERGLLVG